MLWVGNVAIKPDVLLRNKVSNQGNKYLLPNKL